MGRRYLGDSPIPPDLDREERQRWLARKRRKRCRAKAKTERKAGFHDRLILPKGGRDFVRDLLVEARVLPEWDDGDDQKTGAALLRLLRQLRGDP